MGATDQKPSDRLSLRHFEESRTPIEVSFDRLGPSHVDGKVLAFLSPIAKHHGETRKPRKGFGGWVWLKAAQLNQPPKGKAYPVQPSPIRLTEPEHKEHNPYHAHTACTEDSHSVALHLQYLFSTYGKLRECRNAQINPTIVQRITRFFSGLFSRPT